MKGKLLVASLLALVPFWEGTDNVNVPIDSDGMQEVNKKLRKMKSREQSSKRKLKKRRGKY